MKLAIVALCLLGIVAAACAAVLVKGLRMPVVTANSSVPKTDEHSTTKEATTKPVNDPEVVVLYVARTLTPMTVVDTNMVSAKTMPIKDAPPGYLTNAMDVVGKLVSVSLVAGQPFNKNCFLDVSSPRQLAATIPIGKRAVGISVSEYAGLEGLIYPGCMVDVMVSFRAQDGGSGAHRDAVTTTLLENVQVLAVESQTMISPGKVGGESDGRGGGVRRVTLLVTTKQSKALELAMGQGTLSLALRNPLDSSDADKDAVSVRSLMGDQSMSPEAAKNLRSAVEMAMGAVGGFADSWRRTTPATQPSPTRPADPPPHWDTVIIRGSQVETRSFAIPHPKEENPSQESAPQNVAKK